MFRFLGRKIRDLFQGKVSEESIDRLQELFYQADLGVETAQKLTEKVRLLYRKKSSLTSDEILAEIKKELLEELKKSPLPPFSGKPQVILIVGVNGNGKTTTVAKLAHYYQQQKKKVLIVAADTFRAAAVEQLSKWAESTKSDFVKGKQGSDPAAVAFDGTQAGVSRECDLVLIDTAGRLHTKSDLMKELEKIHRAIGKALPGAPHEIWLILDGTVGQNGVEQATRFQQSIPLSGLILTKMEGTAKGGGAFAIQKILNLPLQFIGVGEKMTDLEPFDPQKFVDSLFD